MERLKKAVTRIASTPDSCLSELPLRWRALVPLLSLASALFRLSLSLRHGLYRLGLLQQRRLPVPVISVGNLTWGGNGKTPMVEYIARFFDEIGIPPLILTRGYAGGDEARMLKRHLLHTSTRIGVGTNRRAAAASIFKRHGYMDFRSKLYLENLSSIYKFEVRYGNEKVGAAILDDGMQHLSVARDVEMVMLNGLMPWGNNHLIPRGPLREPLHALCRANIVVIHHADLVSDEGLRFIESTVHNVSATLPIFFSRLAPSHFFRVMDHHSRLPLSIVHNTVVLCVSAIGFPDAFVQSISKIGPLHLERLDFGDHHHIQTNDVDMIRGRLRKLEYDFNVTAIVVVTEKDYDRDPLVLRKLNDTEVLVLCSSFQIMPFKGQTDEVFRSKLKKLLIEQCKDQA